MRPYRKLIAVTAAILLLAQPAATQAQMSPGAWPAAQRDRLAQLAMSPFPPAQRIVTAPKEMVSATLSPEAAQAGVEALRAGGTAADAAVTVALTQVATDLGAVVSYAGVAELVYYEAKTGKVYVLDAGWAAWSGETHPETIPDIDLSGLGAGAGAQTAEQGRKTLVPGFMAGMEAIHQRFGVLPFADLFKPAIWYARNGVTITPLLAGYFKTQQAYLSRTVAGRRFLGQAGGSLPNVGDRFVQPELAATLRAVAKGGARVMYGGSWGRQYVSAVRAESGKASLADMRAYRPTWTEPLSTIFSGATVYGPDAGNPSSCQILEALNLLDAQPQAATPYWQDPNSFIAHSAALRFVSYGHYAPTTLALERQLGFEPSCRSRVAPAYGRAMAPHISELLAVPAVGDAPGHHSASVVVVDRLGDVAALVHSINTVTWGDTGIVVGGIPVSNAGGLYKSRMTHLGADRHIASDMAPVIALKTGKPIVAIATIGSSLVPETVRLAGLLRRPNELAAFAAAPPLLINPDPYAPRESLAQRVESIPAGGYAGGFAATLRERGTQLREEPLSRTLALRGTAALAAMDANGQPRAVETPGVMAFVASP